MFAIKEFSKQRNCCVSHLRKSRKLYHNNLDEKKFNDNKIFRNTSQPFLSNKIVSSEKLTLIEEDETVETNINAVQILNNFFFL